MHTPIQMSEDELRRRTKNEKREQASRDSEALLAARGEIS
jgi:hypothetical protein